MERMIPVRQILRWLVPGLFCLVAVELAQATPPIAESKPLPTPPLSLPRKPMPKPPVRPAAKPPGKPVPPPEPPLCTPGDVGVTFLRGDSDIKCDDEWKNCEGLLDLAVRNCTGEFQAFTRVEVFEGSRRMQVVEFSPAAIAPHNKVWREHLPWTTPGELAVEVYYKAPGQDQEHSVRGTVTLTNRQLALAKQACVQCNGTWGTFGYVRKEQCNCKTTDAGKQCFDGNDCQGYCLFQRYDSDGREEGQCSDQQHIVGCYGIIFKDASKYPPTVPPTRKRATCLD